MVRWRLPVRETPPSARFPHGVPVELLEAEYEPHEVELMEALRRKLEDPDPKVRAEAANEMAVLHEFKALMGARVLTEREEIALGYRRERKEESMVQTTFLEPEGGSAAFPIPDKAKQALGVTEDATLSSPDTNRIGKFHGPQAGAPDTERKAAILAHPNSGTDRRRVLDFIAGQGDRGATDEEVSLALSMRLYTAAPRRNELLNDGWVEESGQRRETTTGTPAAVWVLTEAGREQWRPAGAVA